MSHANVAIFVPHEGCPHRCAFCDQRAISGTMRPPSAQEVRQACTTAKNSLGSRVVAAEIAFFGGSFTAIDRGYMECLLREAQACVRELGFMGIRCSTRPDAVDGEVLSLLKRYGVTAVELGAQSMDDEVLCANWRGHTAKQVEQAAGLIRGHGISLGLQMMTGLYRDTEKKAYDTALKLCALEPDTVRIYPTIVMRGTELARLYEAGRYRPQTVDEAAALCARCLVLFSQRGIRVIRVGLHASRELEHGMLAGPYHPAFHELCQSRMLLERVRAQIDAKGIAPGDVLVKIHPKNLSKLLGQHKKNVEILADLHYNLIVCTDPALPLDVLIADCAAAGQKPPLA